MKKCDIFTSNQINPDHNDRIYYYDVHKILFALRINLLLLKCVKIVMTSVITRHFPELYNNSNKKKKRHY